MNGDCVVTCAKCGRGLRSRMVRDPSRLRTDQEALLVENCPCQEDAPAPEPEGEKVDG